MFLWKHEGRREELFDGNKTCARVTTLCIEALLEMGTPVRGYLIQEIINQYGLTISN